MFERPTCPRQRFTFANNPPTSPANALTVTSALPPESPATTHLARSICPGDCSCHSGGTFQTGFVGLVVPSPPDFGIRFAFVLAMRGRADAADFSIEIDFRNDSKSG